MRGDVGRERVERLRARTSCNCFDQINVERPWLLHWHTQDDFRALVASAGP